MVSIIGEAFFMKFFQKNVAEQQGKKKLPAGSFFPLFSKKLVELCHKDICINPVHTAGLLDGFPRSSRAADAVHSLSHKNRNNILIYFYQICDNHIFGNFSHFRDLLIFILVVIISPFTWK